MEGPHHDLVQISGVLLQRFIENAAGFTAHLTVVFDLHDKQQFRIADTSAPMDTIMDSSPFSSRKGELSTFFSGGMILITSSTIRITDRRPARVFYRMSFHNPSSDAIRSAVGGTPVRPRLAEDST